MIVAAAVSGGMDSLLSLALLRERGFEVMAVHGFFLPEKNEIAAAGLARQCQSLAVPFHAFDLRERFRRLVSDEFTATYARGRTPNPCALCNPAVKFGALFDEAARLGATHLATGHYARILHHRELGRLLTRGVDERKDQSYFLSLLPPGKLERAVFPLGEVHKRDVPAELERRGLEPPLPSESQEICFVPDDDYQRYLEDSGAALPGPGEIILADGSVLGRHAGLWRYTQGQRRGIGVAHPEPLFVLDKLPGENRLVVGPRRELAAAGCVGSQVNLFAPRHHWPDEVLVQTRYRQRAVPARVDLSGEGRSARLTARYLDPGDRPAPGQVLAVYSQHGALLAGAVIESVLETDAAGEGA